MQLAQLRVGLLPASAVLQPEDRAGSCLLPPLPMCQGEAKSTGRRWLGSGPWRQDADDRVRNALEPNGLTDNVAVAVERVLPQAVTQNHSSGSARRIFFGGEAAPQHGSKAKDGKKARGHSLTMNIVSPSGGLQIHTAGFADDGSGDGGNIVVQIPPGITINLDGIAAPKGPEFPCIRDPRRCGSG